MLQWNHGTYYSQTLMNKGKTKDRQFKTDDLSMVEVELWDLEKPGKINGLTY